MKHPIASFVAAAAFAGSVSFSAEAALVAFDFAAVADGDASYGIPAGEYGAPSLTFVKGGLSLTVTAGSASGSSAFFAYLDSGNAGLGVCPALNYKAHCKPTGDDDVESGERLVLRFDRPVTIESLTFRNGGHKSSFASDAEFRLGIDGGPEVSHALTASFNFPLTGTEFVIANWNPVVAHDYTFYLSALEARAVPVPAAVWLFASGLVGLAGVARRRR